jgi:hypothetical protein
MPIRSLLAVSLTLIVLGGTVFNPVVAETTPSPPPGVATVSFTTQLPNVQPAPQTPPAQPAEESSLKAHVTTLPKGTIVMIKIDHPVSSYAGKVGDPVLATSEGDVYVDNQIVLPAGSIIEGTLTGVTPAGHLGKHAQLEMQFNAIRMPNGAVVPLRAHLVTPDDSGILRGDSDQSRVMKSLGLAAGTTAVGTVAGAAAGSILGSVGGGAAFGLAAGGLAGLGWAFMREGKQVVVPAGARLSIVVDQPTPVVSN